MNFCTRHQMRLPYSHSVCPECQVEKLQEINGRLLELLMELASDNSNATLARVVGALALMKEEHDELTNNSRISG